MCGMEEVVSRVARCLLCILLAAGTGALGAAEGVSPHGAPSAPQRALWSLQPIVWPSVPAAEAAGSIRNPVDAFVLRRLDEQGLEMAPPAARAALARRVFLDLVGLPPSPSQVADFVADESPDAYERLIARLLASPHYGERWGRHWLDLARYADSSGFEHDITRPTAWRYRDYVIAAFNEDKPYDRFVQEQLAGDELWPERPEARVATAFNRHYAEEPNQKDLLLARQETLHDITSVVGSTFLGLTFGCAQCHDHKFDPISQRDYYRLQAFFASVNHDDALPLVTDSEYEEYERRLAAWEGATASIWQEMSRLLEPLRTFTPKQLLHRYPDYVIEAVNTPAQRRDSIQEWMYSLLRTKVCGTCPLEPKPHSDPGFWRRSRKLQGADAQRFRQLELELEQFAHLKPDEVARGMGIYDVSPNPPPTYVLGAGLYTSPGEEVQPGFPSALDAGPPDIVPPAGGRSTGRRSALAKWLVDPANPLVARVMVNRIWHYHFGRGIVRTPSDFGLMGARPTHPELLDWLASELVASGWSVKHVHRLILGSATYRQAAGPALERLDRARQTDPFNKLLWKFPARRLEAEIVRDAALSVSGLLLTDIGGPSVFPPLPEGVPKPVGGWDDDRSASDRHRRSVYIFVRRNLILPLLSSLDFPDTHESCAMRNRTTTAPQALSLLNGRGPAEWAVSFAERVLRLAGADPSGQVDAAYRLAYSRDPEPPEKDEALSFLNRHARIVSERPEGALAPQTPRFLPAGVLPVQGAVLADYCLALLNSNEFVYSF